MSDLKSDKNRSITINNFPIIRSWIYYFLAIACIYITYSFMLFLHYSDIIDGDRNKSWLLVLVFAYFVAGFFLNIKIMNKLMAENYLQYHEFTNTIDNVLSDKISFMIWWIFKYPILLIKFALIRKI